MCVSASRLTMEAWDFLKDLLENAQDHTILVGHFWIAVLFIFRIVLLATMER